MCQTYKARARHVDSVHLPGPDKKTRGRQELSFGPGVRLPSGEISRPVRAGIPQWSPVHVPDAPLPPSSLPACGLEKRSRTAETLGTLHPPACMVETGKKLPAPGFGSALLWLFVVAT